MRFWEAVKTCLYDKHSTFSGRASRSEFWWFQLFYFSIMFFLLFMAGLFGNIETLYATEPDFFWLLFFPLALVFAPHTNSLPFYAFLILFLPQLAVFSRRLRDHNWSGWFCSLLAAYPFLLVFVAVKVFYFGWGALGHILLTFVLVYGIPIVWFFIGLRKGTIGDNRFGADPLAPQPDGAPKE